MNWTKELPTEDGFYWYREENSKPEILEWDNQLQWFYACGSEVPLGNYMDCHKITGEHWPIKLTPPQ